MGELTHGAITPHAKFGYIPALDGLRACAVMIVIIAHMGFAHVVPGGFGVTVFFFISGFLITRLLLAEKDAKGEIGLKDFYIRRFLRLLPALYFMLLISSLIMVAMGDSIKIWELICALTYTMNYHNIVLAFEGIARTGPWEHLWSLAVEEHFYLIFPLVLIMTRAHLSRAIAFCALICIGSLLWRLTAYYGLGFPPEYTYSATEARLDSIVYGCLLSLLLHVRSEGRFWTYLIGWLPVLVSVGILLICFAIRDEGFRQTFRYTLQGLALFVGVVNLYYFKPLGQLIHILEGRALKWIGRVSYGLYLWHIPVFMATERYIGLKFGTPPFMLVGLVLTFLITSVSFYYVEKPVIALRRRFGSHVQDDGKRPEQVSETGKLAAHGG